MQILYSILPLVWKGNSSCDFQIEEAKTSFISFSVGMFCFQEEGEPNCYWTYTIGEKREVVNRCSSIEEAKRGANDFWEGIIKKHLVEEESFVVTCSC